MLVLMEDNERDASEMLRELQRVMKEVGLGLYHSKASVMTNLLLGQTNTDRKYPNRCN